MRSVVAVAWCLLLVGAGGAAIVGTGATEPAAATPEANTTQSADANATALGTEISAFVSRTDAETAGTVEREVSTARLDRSNDSAAVRNRVDSLTARYERLRSEWVALERARANGSIPPMAYHARRAALAARTESLNDSVAAVRPAARRTGAATDSLDALDQRLPDAATGPAPPAADPDRGPPNGTLPPLTANDTPPAAGSPPNGTGPGDLPSRSNGTAPGGGPADPANASERPVTDRPASGPPSAGDPSTTVAPPSSPSPDPGPPTTDGPDTTATPGGTPDERPSTPKGPEDRPSTNRTAPASGEGL